MQWLFQMVEFPPWRVEKIVRKHGVTPDEVDEAVADSDSRLYRDGRGPPPEHRQRYIVYGRSAAGRPLVVVLEDLQDGVGELVTARDATPRERGTYFG